MGFHRIPHRLAAVTASLCAIGGIVGAGTVAADEEIPDDAHLGELVGPASHEGEPNGRYSEAQVDTTEGEPGTVIGVSGTCQFGKGVPATDVMVSLGQKVKPWRDTFKGLPVADDSTFDGELVVTIDLPPGENYRLTTTCFADDQAYGVHNFDFEVLSGKANPNHAELTPTQGPPGSDVRVSGVCMFTPDRPAGRVDGVFRESGTFTARWKTNDIAADGSYATSITVPPDTKPGDHSVSLGCVADEQYYGEAHLPFTVIAAQPPTTTTTTTPTTSHATPVTGTSSPDTPALADTGVSTNAGITIAGIALLVGGTLLLLITRSIRRRRPG